MILFMDCGSDVLPIYYREKGVYERDKHIGYLRRSFQLGNTNYTVDLFVPNSPSQHRFHNVTQESLLHSIEQIWLEYQENNMGNIAKNWYTELIFRIIAVELDNFGDESGTITIRETSQGEDFTFKVDDCSEVRAGSVFHLEPGES